MSAIIDFLSYLIASLISAALLHFGAIAITDNQTNDPAIESALVTSEQAEPGQGNSVDVCLDQTTRSHPIEETNCYGHSDQ